MKTQNQNSSSSVNPNPHHIKLEPGETLSELLRLGLLASGFALSFDQPSRKALRFNFETQTQDSEKSPNFLWLGKSGSLRVGPAYTRSRPLRESTKKSIALKGRIVRNSSSQETV